MENEHEEARSIHEILADALPRWQELLGVDLGAQTMSVGDFSRRDELMDLSKLTELDPSGITPLLLLVSQFERYVGHQKVSFGSLLGGSNQELDHLLKVRALKQTLDDPAVKAAREDALLNIRRAMEAYGASGREDVNEILSSPQRYAELRRDAFLSMDRLQIDQFLDGDPDVGAAAPLYVRHVHEWRDINALLGGVMAMPSGVSLNLIRTPKKDQSFFVITARNGGRLFTLTDRPKTSNPFEGHRTRRPMRRLEARMGEHWFPYELLNLMLDEAGEIAFSAETEARLTTLQSESVRLEEISALQAETVVWLGLVFGLMVERYWKQSFQLPSLSYTGLLLKAPAALADHAVRSGLPVGRNQPAPLVPLALKDVLGVEARHDALGKVFLDETQWLEERFGKLVPETILNGVAQHGLSIQVELPSIERIDPHEGGGGIGLPAQQPRAAVARTSYFETVSESAFGSREQLDADRIFVARHNVAKAIGLHLEDNYRDRKRAVLAWYHQRVLENQGFIQTLLGFPRAWTYCGAHGPFASFNGAAAGPVVLVRDNQEILGSDRRHLFHSFLALSKGQGVKGALKSGPRYHLNPEGMSEKDRRCLITGVSAVERLALFTPSNPREIALLAGCAESELPFELQHWDQLCRYHGNPIISRVDPMVRLVESNPWLKLDLRFSVGMSKRAIKKGNAESKPAGLPWVVSWDECPAFRELIPTQNP